MIYRIENTHSAVILGEYDADSAEHALDLWAQDAGYRDSADVEAQFPSHPGEILVTNIQ